MKILYGVQATGNGHITRARALNKYFVKHGLEVDFLFSGRPRDQFFDMDEFGQWRCQRGLTFLHEAGKLKVIQTARHNNLLQLWRDVKNLDLEPYDLVITDFEPITAWAAKRANKTCIGMGHQYAFSHNIPRRGEALGPKLIMKYFAPAKIGLGLHWHHFGQIILPPIVETHETSEAKDPKKIIVYLGFEEPSEVLQLLEPFGDYNFVYYGAFAEYERRGHIELKPLSRDGFKSDLATSSGVICNAGFELSSEAIHLGIKLLVKPLQGQLEQLSNAKALEELALGMSMDTLDQQSVDKWLKNNSASQVLYPNVAAAIVEWISKGNWHDTQSLAEQLWSKVEALGVESFSNAAIVG